PALGDDAQSVMLGTHGALLEPGMELDLVERRGDAGSGDDVLDIVALEIGDADGPRLAFLPQADQRLPGFDILAAKRRGPVDEVKIDIVGAQPLEARIHGPQGPLVALVVVPHLGGEEYLVAGKAGAPDRPAHAVLVFIGGGGVHMAVSG